MTRRIWGLLLAAVLFLFSAGCAQKNESESEQTPSTIGKSGFSMSNFVSLDLDNHVYDQEYFRDYDVTVITIWSTDSAPCMNHLTVMAQLARDYKGRRVGFLGIVANVTDDAGIAQARELAKKAGVKFPNLLPTEELCEAKLYSVTEVPLTFFVDSSGAQLGDDVVGTEKAGLLEQFIDSRLSDNWKS